MKNIIGIIDSGIGGKGIEKEIQKILSNVKTAYLADTKNFPFGTKTVTALNQILSKDVDFLITEGAKIIVLACNSATVSSLQYLRRKFDIPIIGTEPAIKTAAEMTKTKSIAIFATPITSKSEATNHLIKEYCNNITVYKIPFKYLAGLIEHNQTKYATSRVAYLWLKYRDKNIDVVVLGCTHYTLIKQEIQKIVGDSIKLIDSNAAVARQVKKVYDKARGINGKQT